MDPAEMLTLVALTYRGCEYNLGNAHSRKIVFDEVTRCLASFGPGAGEWKIVWGPAGYRPGIAGPDISTMYVAQRVDDPSTLAVAIRGTNFFSVLDWLSNLPLEPRRWEYGGAGPEVKISFSTWLGLRFLQRLQSGPVPAPSASETPAEKLQAAETAAQAALIYVLIRNILQGAAQVDAAGYLSKIKDGIGSIASTFL